MGDVLSEKGTASKPRISTSMHEPLHTTPDQSTVWSGPCSKRVKVSYASLRTFRAMKKLKDRDAMLVAFPPQRGERGGRQCVEIPFSERRRLHLLQRKRAVLAGCSSHQKQMTLEWLASEGVWKGAHSHWMSKKLSDFGTSLDLWHFYRFYATSNRITPTISLCGRHI